MAHAHVSQYATPPIVELHDDEIYIKVGPFSVRMQREEAAQLAADLLNAVEAAPVEAQQADPLLASKEG